MQELTWLGNLITLEGMLLAEWEGIKRKKFTLRPQTYHTIQLLQVLHPKSYYTFFPILLTLWYSGKGLYKRQEMDASPEKPKRLFCE